MDDLAFLDATAQADLVRRKEVKPIELVDAAIDRIERLNPTLNAIVTPMYDEARKVASSPLPDGPFTGVPFVLKDLLAAYGGVRLTSGSAFLRDYIATHDCGMLCLLREKKGFFERLFTESVTLKQTFHSPIPLLILHDQA